MKKIRYKRKIWLDRHSFLSHKKNPKKSHVAFSNCNPQLQQNKLRKIHKQVTRRKQRGRYVSLIAPSTFSLSENTLDVLLFYDRIKNEVRSGNPVFIDLREIKILTIDAIMYFHAIVEDFKEAGISLAFKGNLPDDEKCRNILIDSGFLEDVNSAFKVKMETKADNIKIIKGSISDPSVAKKLCLFTMEKLKVDRVFTRKLYDIISELMTNTKHWAYSDKCVCNWYLFAKYIKNKECVRYTFLDTGKGIPSTIRKKGLEVAADVIGRSSHSHYIISALKGEDFRSHTGYKYRGEGLPRIYSYQEQGYINNLTVISDAGYYSDRRSKDLLRRLKGTLFYWEIYGSS